MLRRRLSATVLLILATGAVAAADLSGMGKDGWHTWQVPAVDSAPEMCCFSWRSGNLSRKQCDLDGRNGGFSSRNDAVNPGDGVQVFALMKNGVATEIRALSTSCPVTARSSIKDLGSIDADDSVKWLGQFVAKSIRTVPGALAAIAVHKGAYARGVLIDSARPGNDEEIREDAIFWMGQVRIGETAAELQGFMFDDSSADIREHAAFSYSQSDAPDAAQVLIRQGKTDKDPDVRSQAWFWLAETEAVESEVAISEAILVDEDEEVREDAVFALSQLPETRAVSALAAILENRQLDMEVREQALFWLAQTESDEAFAYIDRLLSGN